MAVALRAHSSGGLARSATTQTITLTTSTNLGDCVIIAIGSANATPGSWATTTISGLGATWIPASASPDLIPTANPTSTAIFVGYGCSAGQTAITISNLPNATAATTLWGLFSGVLPTSSAIVSYAGNTTLTASTTPATLATSPSASYTAGQLVIGAAYSGNWGSTGSAPVWSNGATNADVDFTRSGNRAPWMSYIIPTGSGSTTYTGAGIANTATQAAGIMVLNAAPVVPVTASGSASASGTATLTVTPATAITGSGSATASGSATLTVTPQVALTGSGSASASGFGSLTVIVILTGTGSASVSGSATVTVTPPTAIVGTGSTSASGAGTLTTVYPLTGSGSGSVSGSGSLVVVPVVPITGSGSASVSGSGTLTPTFPLTGSGSADTNGSGTVALTFILVGQATATVTASASISAFLPLSGSGSATATGSGYLNIYPHTGPGSVSTWWVTGKVRTRTSQGNVEGEELSPGLVGKWETGNLETIVMAPLVQGGAEILKEN